MNDLHIGLRVEGEQNPLKRTREQSLKLREGAKTLKAAGFNFAIVWPYNSKNKESQQLAEKLASEYAREFTDKCGVALQTYSGFFGI